MKENSELNRFIRKYAYWATTALTIISMLVTVFAFIAFLFYLFNNDYLHEPIYPFIIFSSGIVSSAFFAILSIIVYALDKYIEKNTSKQIHP